MQKGLSEETRRIIWEARKKLHDLVFDKEGNYKKGISSRQLRVSHRATYRLMQITMATHTDYREKRLKECPCCKVKLQGGGNSSAG